MERYFQDGQQVTDQGRPGVLDLLVSNESSEAPDWRRCVTSFRPFPEGEALDLISSGSGNGEFVERLQRLDWNELFVRHNLGRRLEQLRDEWRQSYDYVLIDSRTGLSDVGGVCTIYLPDGLVVFFTANDQSVDGIAEAVRRAREARAKLPVDRTYLVAVPVPARDESRTEYKQALRWRNTFADRLGPLYADFLPRDVDPLQALDILKIPNIPYWNFGERLAVVTEGTSDPTSVSYAFGVLAELLRSDLDWSAIAREDVRDADSASRSRPAVSELGPSRKSRMRRILGRDRPSISGPSYVASGPLMARPAPFRSLGATLYVLWAEADPYRIEAFCHDVFAATSGGAVTCRPIGRHLMIAWSHIARVISQTPPYDQRGAVSEVQMAICMPVRLHAPDRLGERLAMVTPYSWLDNAMSLADGREVFGYPNSLGWLQFPSANGPAV